MRTTSIIFIAAVCLLMVSCTSQSISTKGDQSWGDPAGGLRGRIHTDKASYAVGEFPVLTFEIENVSSTGKKIQDHPWFGGRPYGETFISAPDGEVCPVDLLTNAGRPSHVLKPGTRETARLSLFNARVQKMYRGNYRDFLFHIASQHGEFSVRFVYGEFGSRLSSNICKFRVEPPKNGSSWSEAKDGLRLHTRVRKQGDADLLVTSFWNVSARKMRILPGCVGWEVEEVGDRKGSVVPLTRALNASRLITEVEETTRSALILPFGWRTMKPGEKTSVIHRLRAPHNKKYSTLVSVRSVYYYDPVLARTLHDFPRNKIYGADGGAWIGKILANVAQCGVRKVGAE